MSEENVKIKKYKKNLLNAKLGMDSSSPFQEEQIAISYLQILGEDVNMGIFGTQATKCTNPENGAYVIELPENQFGVRFLYPKTINQVDTKNQVLFYIEGQIDPKKVFKDWIEGQIILENHRHKILLERYDNMKLVVDDIEEV